jgi:hypothetical protein
MQVERVGDESLENRITSVFADIRVFSQKNFRCEISQPAAKFE